MRKLYNLDDATTRNTVQVYVFTILGVHLIWWDLITNSELHTIIYPEIIMEFCTNLALLWIFQWSERYSRRLINQIIIIVVQPVESIFFPRIKPLIARKSVDGNFLLHYFQVYPKGWTAILISMDNKGMWNLRSAIWPRRYLGQEAYMRVWNSERSLYTEYDIPDNAILCGKAKQ